MFEYINESLDKIKKLKKIKTEIKKSNFKIFLKETFVAYFLVTTIVLMFKGIPDFKSTFTFLLACLCFTLPIILTINALFREFTNTIYNKKIISELKSRKINKVFNMEYYVYDFKKTEKFLKEYDSSSRLEKNIFYKISDINNSLEEEQIIKHLLKEKYYLDFENSFSQLSQYINLYKVAKLQTNEEYLKFDPLIAYDWTLHYLNNAEKKEFFDNKESLINLIQNTNFSLYHKEKLVEKLNEMLMKLNKEKTLNNQLENLKQVKMKTEEEKEKIKLRSVL